MCVVMEDRFLRDRRFVRYVYGEVFDAPGNNLGQIPRVPGPFMYGSRVAVLHGAKIVFIGGYSVVEGSSIDGTGISSSADVYEFDPEWRKLASMNIPRHDFACAVVDGLLYVVRGKDSCREHILSAEVYNPETNQWSLMDCPDRHVLGDFAFSFKSKLYAVGNGSRFIDVYDLKTKTWEELDSGKSLLVYSYTVIRNKVYFLDYNMSGLGVFDLEENSRSSVFVPHESRSDSWFRLREWNNKVILIAGFRGYNALTGDLDDLDKEDASKWTVTQIRPSGDDATILLINF
ncbi:unnamed protein product [Brassica oleracea]